MEWTATRRAAVAALSAFLAGAGAAYAAAPQADRNPSRFPERGLAIPVLANARPEVAKPAEAHTWSVSRRGGGTAAARKVTVFDPAEVWALDARIGKWTDRSGNTLTIAEARTPLPKVPGEKGLNGGADMDAIKKAMDDAAAKWNPGPAALAGWASSFTGRPFDESQFSSPRVSGVLHSLLVGESGGAAYCFFRLKSGGYKAPPSNWYWMEYRSAAGTPGEGMNLFRTLLSRVSPLRAPGARSSAAKDKSGSAGDPRREAARRSIAGLKGWWSAETPEYIFLLDLPQGAGRSFVNRATAEMAAMRAAYKRYVPPVKEVGSCVARIFNSKEEYQEYMRQGGDGGGTPDWSSGVWVPSREELVVMGNGKDLSNVLQTFRHEGFHQYLFYATGIGNHAMWFNEGHACMFETAERAGGLSVRVTEGKPHKAGKDGSRVLTRAESVDKNPEAIAAAIPSVLSKSHEEFYSGDVGRNYVAAWAVCYFLHKAPLASPRDFGDYSSVLPAYMKAALAGKGPAAATKEAFAKVKGRDISADFLKFWRKWRSRAKSVEPR